MNKRFLSLVLSMAMCFSLMPAASFAAEAASTGNWEISIGNKTFNQNNSLESPIDVFGNGTAVISYSGGSAAKWKIALSNASIKSGNANGIKIKVPTGEKAEIVLTGENSIDSESVCILQESCGLEITGSGSLDLTGKSGISVSEKGSLKINTGGSMSVETTDSGIKSSASPVTVSGGYIDISSEGSAVTVKDSTLTIGGGTVNAKSKNLNALSAGSINITGGDVYAYSSRQVSVLSDREIRISGGDVVADSDTDAAVFSQGNLYVGSSDGKCRLEAKVRKDKYAIYSTGSTVFDGAWIDMVGYGAGAGGGITEKNCVVFTNDRGVVTGNAFTPGDVVIESGMSLNIPKDMTLTVSKGTTLTNDGEIKCGENAEIINLGNVICSKHDTVFVPESEPTITEEGNIEHWKCRICGKTFSDEAAEHEIDLSETASKFVMVTFKVKNGTWSDGRTEDKIAVVNVKAGHGTLGESDIPTGMKASKGFGRNGGAWDKKPDTAEGAVTGNVTYTYTFLTDDMNKYKVEHYFQNANNDGYTLGDTDIMVGKTGDRTKAVPKEYEGFRSAKEFNQKQIPDSGTISVRIEYDRRNYNISWDLSGGTAVNNYSDGSLRFGAKIVFPDAKPPKGKEKARLVWEPEPPETMPMKNVSYKAKWLSPDDKYNIRVIADEKDGEHLLNSLQGKKGDNITIKVEPDMVMRIESVSASGSDGSKIEVKSAGAGKYVFVMPESDVEFRIEFREAKPKPPASGKFKDVAEDAYYYDAVNWADSNNIVKGTAYGRFSPDQACTRGQMVTFMWRAAGAPAQIGRNPFKDVSTDSYYYNAAVWAAKNGITQGVSDDMFAPEQVCTRAQTVTFIHRFAKNPEPGDAGSFTDVSADDYFADAVNWAVNSGITKGLSDTQFGPDASCTRAHIVTFLYRYMG